MKRHPDKSQITAVILAGGHGSRMGGLNKGLIMLQGQPMIDHVIKRIEPQVSTIIISANRDHDAYRQFGYPVIADALPDTHGPLAGIYTAMTVMNSDWLLCIPCDVPKLPLDLATRLSAADPSVLARVAHDGKRQQSVCCLLHIGLRDALQQYLLAGNHAVYRFLSEQHAVAVDFSDNAAAFDNINTSDELQNHA